MSDNVRVAVRVRPMVQLETERGCQMALERVPGEPQIIVSKADSFTFNYVFDVHDSQRKVYEEAVSCMLDKLFEGFNATILAYGQTGSGKTFTMGTCFNGKFDEDAGVIPRAITDIFQRVNSKSSEYEFTITCSFLELYQEMLYDLLSNKSRESSIVDIRELANTIVIPKMTEEKVNCAADVSACLVRGSALRAVASTAMNKESSRSHAIFTVNISARKINDAQSVITSKFHLVDLAGSERSKKTKATGDRFKEGVKINHGLFALGNVISALGTAGTQPPSHVSYRDSKLTRLLQDSLGGNSITLMIACVSPADYNVPETLNTLRYADRARKIKNKPIVNHDPRVAQVRALEAQVQELRLKLYAVTHDNNVTLPAKAEGSANQELKDKNRQLQQQLQQTLNEVATNEMRAHLAEDAHEKLKAKTAHLKLILAETLQEMQSTDMDINKCRQCLMQVHNEVSSMDDEMEKTQLEIAELKGDDVLKNMRNNSCNGNGDGLEGNEEMNDEMTPEIEERTDKYNKAQINMQQQLRHLEKELQVKKELHCKISNNMDGFEELQKELAKMHDQEAKIKDLEAEKAKLQEQLQNRNEQAAAAKLAEERRKRLQILEQKLNEMKRAHSQQQKLLKLREKDVEKIKNLCNEIQEMKNIKVRLLKDMRAQSENFRQFKLAREKELMQLKNKDRKLKDEMVRKEALMAKQHMVMKRKCEEAAAINKRLKEAMERQRMAQAQRNKHLSAKEANASALKTEQLTANTEREIELLISTVVAETTLSQIMEDRAVINKRIAELQAESDGEATPFTLRSIEELREELEIRQVQIKELQERVYAVDKQSSCQNICEQINNEKEAKVVIAQLFKTLADMQRDFAQRAQHLSKALDEQRNLRETNEDAYENLKIQMRLKENHLQQQLREKERLYEDKIAILLLELQKLPVSSHDAALTPQQIERLKIQEEQTAKIEELHQELDNYKQLVQNLQNAVEKQVQQSNDRKKKKSRTAAANDKENLNAEPPKKLLKIEEYNYEISSGSDEDIFENSDADPDWRKTPVVRKARRVSRLCSSSSSTASFATANTHIELKRKSKSCNCRRGACNTKRCGCRFLDTKCSSNCQCTDECTNGKNEPDNSTASASSTISESEPANSIPLNELTYVHEETTNETIKTENTATKLLSPKRPTKTELTFETPSVKKRFFN